MSYQPVNVPVPINVKYHDPDLTPLMILEQGDWIDLRSAEDVEFKAGEGKLVSLGISMQIPDGYEAHILPRSSLFVKKGLLLANSMGIIDGSYCGNNDIWKASLLATRDCKIEKDERICQFRLVKTMKVEAEEKHMYFCFNPVDTLETEDRGGFGSTGEK